MRFLYAKLTGYIGIYNGLGLNSIEIDFSKAKNNITVISGANGCGKSTLLNALNVFPDSNDSFVPTMIASKQLRIFDDGVVYDIFINHPLDNHGNRATTKASIMKNGVELNPNGNVSSYKEIIFNEFDLDSNYITLSHLSGNDRGLADKKPGERKKFVASISSSLDVYNDMYKNLNKKSNVYKNYISNLTSKIGNIGDESYLRSTLLSLNTRYDNIKKQIEDLKTSVIESKTILSINDPNGILQQEYQEVEKEYNRLKNITELAFSFLNDYYKDNFSNDDNIELFKESIESAIESISKIIEKHQSDSKERNSEKLVLINTIQNINENINRDQVRISKLKEEINETLEEELEKAKNQINRIEQEFEQFGFGNIDDVSVDEIRTIIKVLNDIINGIDRIYEITPYNLLEEIARLSINGVYNSELNSINSKIPELKSVSLELKSDLSKLQIELEDLKIMDIRPKKCNIDSCPFLDKSNIVLKKYKSKKSLELLIKDKNQEIIDMEKTISELDQRSNQLNEFSSSIGILQRLITEIETNSTILKKTTLSNDVMNIDILLDHISHGYKFNNIRNTNSLLAIINDIIQYKSLINVKNNLESEAKSNRNNINLLNEYNEEISNNMTLLDENNSKLESLDKEIQFINGLLLSSNNKLNKLNSLYKAYNDWVDTNNQYMQISIKFEDLKQHFKSSAIILEQISQSTDKIVELQKELEPIENQKKEIDNKLILLSNYQNEYVEYKEKFDVIDKLKKYSSPVSGGIQTLFMSLYMNKTLDLANQLLSMIFNGQYRLLDYIINQDEFRMPFIGNGLIVDDISNGSTSQVCMMGTIINLVLLHQASTKFNITRLDEIDGGLDANNRLMFVTILQQIIQILNIEQLFIISHSVEAALSNVDVIQLAPVIGYEDTFVGANIIYNYGGKVD